MTCLRRASSVSRAESRPPLSVRAEFADRCELGLLFSAASAPMWGEPAPAAWSVCAATSAALARALSAASRARAAAAAALDAGAVTGVGGGAVAAVC